MIQSVPLLPRSPNSSLDNCFNSLRSRNGEPVSQRRRVACDLLPVNALSHTVSLTLRD